MSLFGLLFSYQASLLNADDKCIPSSINVFFYFTLLTFRTDQTMMGVPPVSSAVFFIAILAKHGCLVGIIY
jgi:hypothetical protein